MFLFEFLGWRFQNNPPTCFACEMRGHSRRKKDVVCLQQKVSGSAGMAESSAGSPSSKFTDSPHFLLKTIPYFRWRISAFPYFFPGALASGRRRRCCWTSALAREPPRWRCNYCRTVGMACILNSDDWGRISDISLSFIFWFLVFPQKTLGIYIIFISWLCQQLLTSQVWKPSGESCMRQCMAWCKALGLLLTNMGSNIDTQHKIC